MGHLVSLSQAPLAAQGIPVIPSPLAEGNGNVLSGKSQEGGQTRCRSNTGLQRDGGGSRPASGRWQPSTQFWNHYSPKYETWVTSFPWRSCNSGTRGSFSSPWERSSWVPGSSVHEGEDTHPSAMCSHRKPGRVEGGPHTGPERRAGDMHTGSQSPWGPGRATERKQGEDRRSI